MASRWIDPLNSVFCERLVSEAVEKICEIDISERAETIRDTACDLALIGSHLLYLATLAREVGAHTAYHYILRDREGVLDLIELLTGARQGHHFIRIGGVHGDISEGFIDRTIAWLTVQRLRRVEYQATWIDAISWIDRTFGLATLSAEQCSQFAIRGPNQAASSHELGGSGDVFSRVRRRLDEIDLAVERSLERLERIPEGEFLIAPVAPDFLVHPGTVQHSLEGPRGLLSVELNSSGGGTPKTIHISSSLERCIPAIEQSLVGVWLDDFYLVLKSFDLNLGEIDR